ncbi:MAG: hypothetical protein AAFU49_13055 [Pseudomonadota bacterium]
MVSPDTLATVDSVLWLASAWMWCGLAVAVVFLLWGIDRVEPNARGAYAFRPLMVPGIALLWPLVLGRWLWLETGRVDPLSRHRPPRAWHGRIWLVLSIALPAILVAGLMLRTAGPLERAPLQIAPPAGESQ